MRLNILAFAAGIVCLQMQPELPAWEAWLAGGLLLLAGQRVRRNAATRGLAIVACLAIATNAMLIIWHKPGRYQG